MLKNKEDNRLLQQPLLFQNNVVGDHDDAPFGYLEVLGVGFGVEADGEAGGHLDAVFDDGPLHLGPGADLHIIPEDGRVHPGPSADADAGREDGFPHRAFNGAAGADEAVFHDDGLAGIKIFGGGVHEGAVADGPFGVIKVEDRVRAQKVLMRLEIGVQQTDVPPVPGPAGGGIVKIKGIDLFLAHHVGDDIAPEIVFAPFTFGVPDDLRHQDLGLEEIDPHGGQSIIRVTRDAWRVFGLFQKFHDL